MADPEQAGKPVNPRAAVSRRFAPVVRLRRRRGNRAVADAMVQAELVREVEISRAVELGELEVF